MSCSFSPLLPFSHSSYLNQFSDLYSIGSKYKKSIAQINGIARYRVENPSEPVTVIIAYTGQSTW
jgi:hypothetical protein